MKNSKLRPTDGYSSQSEVMDWSVKSKEKEALVVELNSSNQ